MVELRKSQWVERLRIIARVIEKRTASTKRDVDIAEPHKVDTAPGQPIGDRVSARWIREGERRQQGNTKKTRPAALLELKPSLADDHAALFSGRSIEESRGIERRVGL